MLSRSVLHAASGVRLARHLSAQSLKPSFFDRILNDAASQNPLNEEFPGLPATKPAPAIAPSAEQFVLSNGVRVISIENGGSVANVGVFAQAGSRYDNVPGTAHFVEHLAFSSSTTTRSAAKTQHDVDTLGATVSSSAGREVLAFTGEVLREDAPELLSIIGDTVRTNTFKLWEIEEAKHVFAELVEAQTANPRIAVLEGVHAAAYGPSSPLGHGLYATSTGLAAIDDSAVHGLLSGRVTAKHIVVSAVNVGRATLEDALIKAGIASLPEGTATERSTGAAPTFLGGEYLVRTVAGSSAHVAIAFDAPSLSSPSLHALGVWQALLGGTPLHGGAAGQLRLGPQRYNRIARSVHTEAHSFIQSLAAFALPYSDGGLLGFAGTVADHESGRLIHAIAGFLKDSAGQPISPEELARAKKQYKLAYLLQTEGRAGAAADAAHQVLLSGKWQATSAALAAIDAVTAADVQKVAATALASAPAITAFGSLEQVPRYDVLASLFK